MRMNEYVQSLVIDVQNGKKVALNQLRDIFYDDMVEVIVRETGSNKKVDVIIRSVFKDIKNEIASLRHPAAFEDMLISMTVAECRGYVRPKKNAGRIGKGETTYNPYPAPDGRPVATREYMGREPASGGYAPPADPSYAPQNTAGHSGMDRAFASRQYRNDSAAQYAHSVPASAHAYPQSAPIAAPCAPAAPERTPSDREVRQRQYATPVGMIPPEQRKNVPFAVPYVPAQPDHKPLAPADEQHKFAQPLDMSTSAQMRNLPFAAPSAVQPAAEKSAPVRAPEPEIVPAPIPKPAEAPKPVPVSEPDPAPVHENEPAPASVRKVTSNVPKVGLLVCTKGDNAGTNFSLIAGSNLIGVSDDCNVCISDETLAADLHIEIYYDDMREIFSLKSARIPSLLMLNGNRVDSSIFLKPHDTIRIGKSEFMLVPFQ